ncbi:MAG: LSU ribosomal protein [Desulfobulbaceae bacterium]|nr:MAG: LSU ribosomal protein [Desulfobulbaceae bacterium]
MRHRKAGRKLGRTSSHRDAMFRNMVTSLFEHERIVTTTPKAKEARRIADKMITLAKKGDLHARRQALSYIRSKDIVAKLFEVIHLKFTDRNGGYTRIVQTGIRRGDAAPMAILELVGYQEVVEVKADN